MAPESPSFLMANAPAIFGIIGVIFGGLLSFVTSYVTKNQEFKLKVWSSFIDKRIKAHELVIAGACEMRVMTILGGIDKQGELRRAPRVLLSEEHFASWFGDFVSSINNFTVWLTEDTKRELNFVQDYVTNLNSFLRDSPQDKYITVGEIIRHDFLKLSSDLEKSAYQYFTADVLKTSLADLDEWHKYKLDVTKARLNDTELFKQRDLIMKVIKE